MYILLDGKEENLIYSAAQQKTVKNVMYDIMKETPEQNMTIVVREMKRRKRGGEDEAGGGVVQPSLLHLLQDVTDQ